MTEKAASRALRKAQYQEAKLRDHVLTTVIRAENASNLSEILADAPTAQLWLLNAGVARGVALKEISFELRNLCDVSGSVAVWGDRRHAFALAVFDSVADSLKVVDALRERRLVLPSMNGRVAVVEYSTRRQLAGADRVGARCLAPDSRVVVEDPNGTSVDVPGVHVLLDFITEAEEAAMLADIDARQWIPLAQRRVQHYGYAFDYAHNNVDLTQPLPGPRPPFFDMPLDRAAQLAPKLVPFRCDQLTLNEYQPHDQIPPHVDTHHAFEDPILSLSLGSHTVMDFRLPVPLTDAAGTAAGTVIKRASVFLPRRSLLVLSGSARYEWWHGIAQRVTDVVEGRVLQRGRRVSLTYRRVRNDPICACPFVAYCPTQLAEIERKRASATLRDHETAVERRHVADVYDTIAPHFSATRYKPWPRVAEFVDALADASVLLDVGCGNGRYMTDDRRFLHVGLDRSIGLLQQCIAQAPGRELCLGSALALPYRDACVDAAMTIAVVHHFSTLERRIDAVREMARVVRPGGPILITVWAWEQEKFKNELSQDLFVQWQNSEDGVTYQRYYHLFQKGELESVCAAVDTVELVNSYYDTDNWVVILRRKSNSSSSSSSGSSSSSSNNER